MSRVGIDQVESGRSAREVKRISQGKQEAFSESRSENSKALGWDSGSSLWLQKLREGPSPGGDQRPVSYEGCLKTC